jgi:deferrochelatase/peroxidase EfeB
VKSVDPAAADEPAKPDPTSRRAFLAGAGAAALAGLGAACASSQDAAAGGSATDDAGDDTGGTAAGDGTDGPEDGRGSADGGAIDHRPPSPAVSFRADRQLAVLRPATAFGLVASFDVLADSEGELSETLQALGAEVERIMTGGSAEQADEILPPPDSGILAAAPASTSVTLGFGASLFDDRFGLEQRRPSELILMPQFFNDRLVQPDLSHGDVAMIVNSDSQQGAVHALHQAVRATDRKLRLRWVQEGYNQLLGPEANSTAPTRNLMGFRDGTSNLDTGDGAVMDRHVWVQPGDDEPAWAVGGTYLAVRIIRILVEFWATAALVRQEQIFGRHRDSGAPLGQSGEGEEPAFSADPGDLTIPVQSHMRRANPRTAGTGRILRRGFSYLNGADGGVMDQGLLFLAYQRSLRTGFLEVQARLDGEPMEDYVKPVGGGLFFIPPGPGSDGWLGHQLLA